MVNSIGVFLWQLKLAVILICVFQMVVGSFGFKNPIFVGVKTVVGIVQTGL